MQKKTKQKPNIRNIFLLCQISIFLMFKRRGLTRSIIFRLFSHRTLSLNKISCKKSTKKIDKIVLGTWSPLLGPSNFPTKHLERSHSPVWLWHANILEHSYVVINYIPTSTHILQGENQNSKRISTSNLHQNNIISFVKLNEWVFFSP